MWDVTVFTKNRERLIEGAVSQRLLEAVLVEAREHDLLSEEHFTVDGTLIQAWAAARSFKQRSDSTALHQPTQTQTDRAGLRLVELGPSVTPGEATRTGSGGLVLPARAFSLIV